MDQRDNCPGSTRESTPSQVKGTRTRHHEQPFEDQKEVVGEKGRRKKGRWIELWALLDVSCEKGERATRHGGPLLSNLVTGTNHEPMGFVASSIESVISGMSRDIA